MTYRGHMRTDRSCSTTRWFCPRGPNCASSRLPNLGRTLAERFGGLFGCVSDLPADMAENHDHYIPRNAEEMTPAG